jgi:hypothetical protein
LSERSVRDASPSIARVPTVIRAHPFCSHLVPDDAGPGAKPRGSARSSAGHVRRCRAPRRDSNPIGGADCGCADDQARRGALGPGRLFGPAGACSYRPRCPHPCWRKRSGHFNQGVVFRARALYHMWLRWSWWEAGVANYSFLVHAPRPLIDALIRTARRLASSRGPCRGVGAAA